MKFSLFPIKPDEKFFIKGKYFHIMYDNNVYGILSDVSLHLI